MPRDDGALGPGTEILVSGMAGFAVPAIRRVPTQADRGTDLQVLDVVTDTGNLANDLVAAHEWVLRHPPLVLDHAQITVTDAAVEDIDLNLVGEKLPNFVGEWLEWFAGLIGGVGVDGRGGFHGCLSWRDYGWQVGCATDNLERAGD